MTRDGWNLFAGSEEWVAPVHAQVGPDGAVWVADWYNFITQHNPTPTGFSNGKGNAYETSLRDRMRGRIYRVVVQERAAGEAHDRCRRTIPRGSSRRSSSDNMFWRLTAQRLIVERGQKDVVPQLLALVRNQSRRCHRHQRRRASRALDAEGTGRARRPTGTDAYRAAVRRAEAPGGRRAQGRGDGAAEDAAAAAAICRSGTAARSGSAHAAGRDARDGRHAARRQTSARRCTRQAGSRRTSRDRWLSRAFFIAATRHERRFLTSTTPIPSELPFTELPVPLRHRRDQARLARAARPRSSARGRTWTCPATGSRAGLPDFDGVVWFTRTFDVAAGARGLGDYARPRQQHVGSLGERFVGHAAAGGRAAAAAAAAAARLRAAGLRRCRPARSRPGANTLTVRVQNNRNDGGFLGTPDSMHVEAGGQQHAARGHVEVPRRAPDQRRRALFEAGRAGRARRVHGGGGAAGAPRSLPPRAAGARRHVPARRAPRADEVRSQRADGRSRDSSSRSCSSTPTRCSTTSCSARRARWRRSARPPTSWRRRPTGSRSSTCRTCRRCCASTRLVDPGQTLTFRFRAPAQHGPVSLRLHVPRPLADHERRASRGCARRTRAGRSRSVMATRRRATPRSVRQEMCSLACLPRVAAAVSAQTPKPKTVEVLFLGHNSKHHDSCALRADAGRGARSDGGHRTWPTRRIRMI